MSPVVPGPGVSARAGSACSWRNKFLFRRSEHLPARAFAPAGRPRRPSGAGGGSKEATMAQTFTGRKRVRKFFGKIEEVAEMPNLIEVQKASYDQFLLVKEPHGGRPDEGLQAVFKSVFPISDFSNTAQLEFVRYEFEPPKYDVDECRQRGMTFAAPLKVTLRLIVFDIDEETGARSVKDIKEQDVYMGDIPLMTMNGTFIVN